MTVRLQICHLPRAGLRSFSYRSHSMLSSLHIERHGAELVVETSIAHASPGSRRAMQKYTIDGEVSVSTGADGDEFHTRVTRRGSSLVFTIEEHEDGHILHSQETWSLIEKSATLERIRERPNGKKQILFNRRRQSLAG
jgi:hypothetical protein